jgi:ABC-type bacteriocin/lantibiotic exporter with double-glycine peptidase domain
MLWPLAATIFLGAPVLITFMLFFIYRVVEKRDLIPSIVFTALSLFSLFRVPIDQLADMIAHVQEAKVSVNRVEEFLHEEETEKYDPRRLSDRKRTRTILLPACSRRINIVLQNRIGLKMPRSETKLPDRFAAGASQQ